MDYKSTLNLPETDFPMKAELPKREPDFLKRWEEEGIFEKLLAQNRAKRRFILHDGPPYANGHIHFGHILNKVLKDIIVKYKNMKGFYAPFVPGWDCHGLPIELGAVNEKKEEKRDGPVARRSACRKYALDFVAAQKAEFVRLGIFADWEHPYLTLTNGYEADTAREFLKLYLAGYVIRGKKPVHWCHSCRTALAEAEVDYEDHSSPSIYVRFPLLNPEKLGLADEKIDFVIWTTTPWTLPANLALAVGPSFQYVVLELGNRVFIVAQDLKEAFKKAIGFEGDERILKTLGGNELASLKLACQHPFMKRESVVVTGDHVTLETGTGVVHIAPGHGQEDYQVGQANGLPPLCPIDEAGKIMVGALQDALFPEVKTWEGLFITKADEKIVPFLHEKGFLLNQPGEKLSHSYPHCWRCKKPVIFRATEQWFLSLSHNDLRKKALRAITGDVRWIPSWGQDRIYGMIEGRPDWCLSRQRIWGVPIIIHFCDACKKPLLDQKIGDHICNIFEERGADAWWEKEPLLPKGTKCSCGGKDFTRESSILDVWFDSGVSHAAVLEKNENLESPADLYLEGSDQHRGWFHSSLLTSMATRNCAPYKAVLTHGFVVDGAGKKYSKSAKNYVPPDKVLNEMGAELLRLWVGAEDYRNDIRVSPEIIKVLAEIYRKIRNTCRFILGNLNDFDPAKHTVPFEKRTEIDRYALSLLARVVGRVDKAYDSYEFHTVHHTLNKFFTVDLSALYLDILKDRLYCDKAGGFLRRSAQSTMYDILMSVVPLLAPILSFTAEEIWSHMKKTESVFLAPWPVVAANTANGELEARWERIGGIRDSVLKVLEVARKAKEIGHGLDAKVEISAEGEVLSFLKQVGKEWPQILIVSQVSIKEGKGEAGGVGVKVFKADGAKCERCWNYSVEVGENKKHPALCGRCVMAVS